MMNMTNAILSTNDEQETVDYLTRVVERRPASPTTATSAVVTPCITSNPTKPSRSSRCSSKRREQHPVPRLLLVDYTKSRAPTTTEKVARCDQTEQNVDHDDCTIPRQRQEQRVYPKPLKATPQRAMSLESAVETTVSLLDMSMTGDALNESRPEYSKVDELVEKENEKQRRRMTVALGDTLDPKLVADFGDISQSNIDFSTSMDDTTTDASKDACFVRRRRRSSSDTTSGISNFQPGRRSSSVESTEGIINFQPGRRRSSVESTYTEDGGTPWSAFGRNVSNPYIRWDQHALGTTPFGRRRDLPSQQRVSFKIKRSGSAILSTNDDELILAAAQALWSEEDTALNEVESLDEDKEKEEVMEANERRARASVNLCSEAAKQVAAEQFLADQRAKLAQVEKRQANTARTDNETGIEVNSAVSTTTNRRAVFAITGRKTSAGTIRMMEQGGESANPRIVTLGGSSRDVMVAVSRMVATDDEQDLTTINNKKGARISSSRKGSKGSKVDKAKQQKTLLAQFDGHQSIANISSTTASHHFLKTESSRALMSASDASLSHHSSHTIDNNALDSASGASSRLTSLLGGVANPYIRCNEDGKDEENIISAVMCNTTATDGPPGLMKYSLTKESLEDNGAADAAKIRKRRGAPRRTRSCDDNPRSAPPSLLVSDATGSDATKVQLGLGGSLSYHGPRQRMSDTSDSSCWSAYRVDSSRRSMLASTRRKLMADTSERLLKEASFGRPPHSSMPLSGDSFRTARDQVSTHSLSEVMGIDSFHTAKMDESSTQNSFYCDYSGGRESCSTISQTISCSSRNHGFGSRRNLMVENKSRSMKGAMGESGQDHTDGGSDTSHFVTGSRIRRIEHASDLTGSKYLARP